MKLLPGPSTRGAWRSPPARGRGLKQDHSHVYQRRLGVAPRAGAWIETAAWAEYARRVEVAPRAGAWIETSLGGS